MQHGIVFLLRAHILSNFQNPLRELVVFHPDTQYLEDVRSLLPYVEQELNIHTVTFTSDEAFCGIQYRATADMTILGKKLRKNIKIVKDGLALLTSQDVKDYLSSGTISIGGIELIAGDLTGNRYVELPARVEGGARYDHSTDHDVVVLLDVERYPELEAEGTAREVVNRVQRLRKKAGLVATDEIDVFYRFTEGMGEALLEAVESCKDMVVRVLKKMPRPDSERTEDRVVVEEEEQEIGEGKITLVLVRA